MVLFLVGYLCGELDNGVECCFYCTQTKTVLFLEWEYNPSFIPLVFSCYQMRNCKLCVRFLTGVHRCSTKLEVCAEPLKSDKIIAFSETNNQSMRADEGKSFSILLLSTICSHGVHCSYLNFTDMFSFSTSSKTSSARSPVSFYNTLTGYFTDQKSCT